MRHAQTPSPNPVLNHALAQCRLQAEEACPPGHYCLPASRQPCLTSQKLESTTSRGLSFPPIRVKSPKLLQEARGPRGVPPLHTSVPKVKSNLTGQHLVPFFGGVGPVELENTLNYFFPNQKGDRICIF